MHSHIISDRKQEVINQTVQKTPETVIIVFNVENIERCDKLIQIKAHS